MQPRILSLEIIVRKSALHPVALAARGGEAAKLTGNALIILEGGDTQPMYP